MNKSLDLHHVLDANTWGELRDNTPLTLTESDLDNLSGINENITMEEVIEIYLPLSRLLSMYIDASKDLYNTSSKFLGRLPAKVPFVIGIAGSVAVGKSTTARVLQKILANWPTSPRVDLVTTDGFLYSNSILEERNILDRKGFPESYDKQALLNFMAQIKAGADSVSAPVYSHLSYDVVADELNTVSQPDVVIIEGLTMLQTGPVDAAHPVYISDYFDFSIFVDANPEDIEKWYVERFLALREITFSNPDSYFSKYASLSDDEAIKVGTNIWETINQVNLVENIQPTRERADLILTKDSNHRISQVKLRKL